MPQSVDRRPLAARGLEVLQLAAYVAAVYLGVLVLPGAVGRFDASAFLLSVVATALVALTFDGVRKRARAVAARLAFGTAATSVQVATDFADHIGRSLTDDELLTGMAEAAARGTAASCARVWMFEGALLRNAATYPPGAEAAPPVPRAGVDPSVPGVAALVPIEDAGEVLGALTIERRPGRRADASDLELLAGVAAVGGISVRNARLRAELRKRVHELDSRTEELRASRRRIVDAQDRERRALERDIHDGLQQYLTALRLKVTHAKIRVARESSAVSDVHAELQASARDALDATRDLSIGLYPKELSKDGVLAALEGQAGRQPFALHVSGTLRRHAPDVEAAVYFACMEALQNVAKHARASTVSVVLEERDDTLAFCVQDDGEGFDVGAVRGTGLQAMGDRLAAMAGAIEILSEKGKGTRVSGYVPSTKMSIDG